MQHYLLMHTRRAHPESPTQKPTLSCHVAHRTLIRHASRRMSHAGTTASASHTESVKKNKENMDSTLQLKFVHSPSQTHTLTEHAVFIHLLFDTHIFRHNCTWE